MIANKRRVKQLLHMLSFWDYALEFATRILNMVPTKKVDKTIYELWYEKVPNLSYLKVWGCEALVKRDTPDKLQQRSVKCIFIGYPKEPIEVDGHSLGDLNEPASYKAAMLDSESNKWVDAINTEIQSMIDNMIWVLVDLPPGSRLVAKGYTQLYGINYEETFSPVADIRAIRILISIAAYYDYEIWIMDVKIAFLNGYLDEDIYMVQPEGNHIPSLQSVKHYLGKCFAKKDLGEATFIFGIKIYRDGSKRLIGLGQNAYIDKILKRYKMDNSKHGHIPMQERLELNKTQGASTPKEVKRMQNVPYASDVGSIMYAVRCTRPNVAFTQNITSCFQQNPGEYHWTVVKNILKYLRNTKDMFLVYGRNPEAELRVDCYYDAGFKTDRDDTKSHT
nr:hypothetical protein [Tanacetum cinerariifolium]